MFGIGTRVSTTSPSIGRSGVACAASRRRAATSRAIFLGSTLPIQLPDRLDGLERIDVHAHAHLVLEHYQQTERL